MIFLGIFRITWDFLRFLRIFTDFFEISRDFYGYFEISADLYGIWDLLGVIYPSLFFEVFTPRSFPSGRAYQWHAHAVACCLKISYMLGTHINKLCKQS